MIHRCCIEVQQFYTVPSLPNSDPATRIFPSSCSTTFFGYALSAPKPVTSFPILINDVSNVPSLLIAQRRFLSLDQQFDLNLLL